MTKTYFTEEGVQVSGDGLDHLRETKSAKRRSPGTKTRMKTEVEVVYRMVKGAVNNTAKQHPDYFVEENVWRAADGIAKRAAKDIVKTLNSRKGSAKAEK